MMTTTIVNFQSRSNVYHAYDVDVDALAIEKKLSTETNHSRRSCTCARGCSGRNQIIIIECHCIVCMAP